MSINFRKTLGVSICAAGAAFAALGASAFAASPYCAFTPKTCTANASTCTFIPGAPNDPYKPAHCASVVVLYPEKNPVNDSSKYQEMGRRCADIRTGTPDFNNGCASTACTYVQPTTSDAAGGYAVTTTGC